MKTLFRTLTAAAAAFLMATSASAVFTDASPALLKQAEPIPVVAKGMAPVAVTSSVADFTADTSPLFDGKADTSVDVDLKGEGTSVVLRAATGFPTALSAVALITSSENEAQLTVRIWGTNDSTEKEWTPLSFALPVVRTGDWRILNITEPEGGWEKAEKYAFYKIEFTSASETGFTFCECLLIRPDLGEPVLSYGSAEVVPVGQTPPVISSADKEPENILPRKISRGLFFPGFTK